MDLLYLTNFLNSIITLHKKCGGILYESFLKDDSCQIPDAGGFLWRKAVATI
jgi:hypothetical protein